MLEIKKGNILSEDIEALVNTVNCVGVMGRGIALQFKKAFPENYKEYEKACNAGQIQPGKMFVHETGRLVNPKYIINFPTKRHWRGKSRIEDIQSGMNDLVNVIKDYGISSIAIPPLGCGLGGLEWQEVKPVIVSALSKLEGVHTVLFEPSGSPDAVDMKRSIIRPSMTPGRAALVTLVGRYLDVLLDPYVTLLEVQKLMYFLQEIGEPLKLRYKKADYGPYAENLRHVLNTVEGYYLSGFADGGERPNKRLELVPGAIEDAKKELRSSPKTLERTQQVIDLVNGFESSFGLELLATVHWVCRKGGAETWCEVVSQTYSWNTRKRKFSERQISIAYDTLKYNGWICTEISKDAHAYQSAEQ